MSLEKRVRRDPLAAFLVVVWALTISLAAITRGMGEERAYGLFTLAVMTPLAAAIIVVGVGEGRVGIGALLRSGLRWRFAPRWYVVAALAIGAVYLVAGAVAGGVELGAPSQGLGPFALRQAQILVGEELGWRGLALARARERLGSLGAALAIGAQHALWHVPLYLILGRALPVPFWFLLASALTWSVLWMLLLARTGSVLACMVLHLSINTWAAVIDLPAEALGPVLAGYALLAVGAAALLPRPLVRFHV